MGANEVLIIRSASFQQLDKNIPPIVRAFPDCSLSMLTHEHGVKLAEKYSAISYIFTYPFKGSFSFLRRSAELKSKQFDAVIIPVSNLTGAGFYNVLFYSLTLRTKKRFVCNLISEIKSISAARIVSMGIKAALFSLVAGTLTLVCLIPLLILFPFLAGSNPKTLN